MHPDNKKKGRKFKVSDKFFIAKEDFKNIKNGEIVRLMDCLNFVKLSNSKNSKGLGGSKNLQNNGKKFVFDSVEYDKEKCKKLIHWIPADENVKASVLMPDNKLAKGLAETGVKKLKENDIIQFERVGFVRLDNKKEMNFWFGHR